MSNTMSKMTLRIMEMNIDGFQRKEFKKYLKAYLKELMPEEPYQTINELTGFSFIPDGFVIDKKNKIVTIYEVEDTHKLSPSKLAEICYYSESFDYYTPQTPRLCLVVTDRYGNNKNSIDLEAGYVACLACGEYD